VKNNGKMENANCSLFNTAASHMAKKYEAKLHRKRTAKK
jgi:hypothetical protein